MSAFGAFTCHCSSGLPFLDGEIAQGKNVLPSLAKSTANDESWNDIAPEEQEQLIQQLCDSKAKRDEKKVTKVTQALVGNDIEGTLLRLNAEVSSRNTKRLAPSDCRRSPACRSVTAVTYSMLFRAPTSRIISHQEPSQPLKSKKPVSHSSSTHLRRCASRLTRSSLQG